jgi:hypothetical protein
MRTLVVYGTTIVLASASVYYLLRLASAKRDDTAKGELAVHNICRLDGISLFLHPDLTIYLTPFPLSLS